MSTQPIFIDNYSFAKSHQQLSGTLMLTDCPRLSEFLEARIMRGLLGTGDTTGSKDATQDSIRYTLKGITNALGQHFLHLTLVSDLTVLCQRCIEPMLLHLNLNFSYLISDAHFDNQALMNMEESDEFDVQEANESMDLIALIEDEIMMAMPIAPTHEAGCSKVRMQSGEKPNPFAVLKNLIKP